MPSLIVWALLTLSSCAQIEIKDHVAYGDKGAFGATAVHTLFTSIPPKPIEKTDWDILRIGMVCMAVADLSEIQQSVDELCTAHKNACDYDTQVKIANIRYALDQLKLSLAQK